MNNRRGPASLSCLTHIIVCEEHDRVRVRVCARAPRCIKHQVKDIYCMCVYMCVSVCRLINKIKYVFLGGETKVNLN